MMRSYTKLISLSLLCSLAFCVAENLSDTQFTIQKLQQKVERLQVQNEVLAESLTHFKKRESQVTEELSNMRVELEALGVYPLGADDERLTQAVANQKILEDRLRKIEESSYNLGESIRDILQSELSASPKARIKIESALRVLDVEIGLREKPRSQVERGNLNESRIISIDSQSGLLVLNAGSEQQMRIGMKLRIVRGGSKIAEALINRVRSEISGALVVKLEDTNKTIRLGDTASLIASN